MLEELEKIIEMAKQEYDIKGKNTGFSVFLVIHDDGSAYIQEASDDRSFDGLDSYESHIKGDALQCGRYKAIIKLIK